MYSSGHRQYHNLFDDYGKCTATVHVWEAKCEFGCAYFNNFVAQTLLDLGSKHNILHCHETSVYIKIISIWWDVVNVKTPKKGLHKKTYHRQFTNTIQNQDVSQNFFEIAVGMERNSWWLRKIKKTFTALRNTCNGLLSIADHCLSELGLNYVFGKVTDRLARGTFWSISPTFTRKALFFLTSFWKWDKTTLAVYSKAETKGKEHIVHQFWDQIRKSLVQVSRQDFAAEGTKPQGGGTFFNKILDVRSSRSAKPEMGVGHHWPLAGDNPGLVAYQTIEMSSLRCYAMTILWKLKITNP